MTDAKLDRSAPLDKSPGCSRVGRRGLYVRLILASKVLVVLSQLGNGRPHRLQPRWRRLRVQPRCVVPSMDQWHAWERWLSTVPLQARWAIIQCFASRPFLKPPQSNQFAPPNDPFHRSVRRFGAAVVVGVDNSSQPWCGPTFVYASQVRSYTDALL
jgi:hypothetical protein